MNKALEDYLSPEVTTVCILTESSVLQFPGSDVENGFGESSQQKTDPSF